MINEHALKAKLQVVARERNIHFNACWKQLLLERFLARLAGSIHANKFIFKGGFLLSYLMKIGRETTDLDFLLTRINAAERELQETFEQILSVYSADGFTFSFDSIELLSQPHMHYPGFRIVLSAAFAKMKDKVQVDVGVGDIVEPLTREIPLVQYCGKPFFESAISLLVYPVETIFSEKLETILSKGASNSRMKDYHDLILLIRNEGMLSLDMIKRAVTSTFSHRGTILRMIEFDEGSLKVIQRLWIAHLHGLGNNAQDFDLPREIASVIEEINKYVAAVNGLAVKHDTINSPSGSSSKGFSLPGQEASRVFLSGHLE
jgi:predicted nucleotidyltransferase component of viral defense system